jgi:hypothetical protein
VPLLCGKALRKVFHLAIGSLGAGRQRSGQIPANRRPGPAGRGRGRFHGALGVEFRAHLGREGAGEAGAPTVRRGSRCGRCAGEVGLRRRLGEVWGLEWVPRKVGESLLGCTVNRARSSTAAASNGAGGGSVRGMAGTRRAATVL